MSRRNSSSSSATTEPVAQDDAHQDQFLGDEVGLVSGAPVVASYSKHSPFICCSPRSRAYRFLILFLISLLSISGYFIYDNIGALQCTDCSYDIQTHLNISDSQISLLYSVYTFPNMILPFFGGYLLDSVMGIRLGVTLCLGVAFLGTALVSVATYLPYPFYIMLVGRFLFGIGTETSYVAQNSVLCHWFNGEAELALAMGLSVSAGRLGAFFTYNLNAAIANAAGYQAALWFATFLSGLAFVGGLLFVFFDRYAEKTVGKRMAAAGEGGCERIHPGAFLNFCAEFWLLSLLITLYYSAIFPFQSFATKLFQKKYNYSPTKAGRITSILPLTSLFLSPIFGILVDKVRRRVLLSTMGTLLLVPAFLLVALTGVTPIATTLMIGVAFSLVPAAIWPCVPILIEEKYTGTAFGLLSAFINSSLTGVYYLQAAIGEHISMEVELLVFAGIGALGVVVGIVWNLLDMRRSEPRCN